MSLGGSQEDWDAQLSRFNFGAGNGLNAPVFSFSPIGTVPGGDDWRRWAEGEIIKERKRVEKLVGVVKALVDANAKGGMTASMDLDQESNGISPSVLQELQEISLSFDVPASPIAGPMPSPSPSPSPQPFSRHQYSPNIFITSPTSPSPYPNSHSRSPSRESLAHTIPPTLSINPTATGSSQFSHPLHTPSSSPTMSDCVQGFFKQGSGHARNMSHPNGRRQPNITLTLETDDMRVEKRARTEGENVKVGTDAGLRTGEEMDIVPTEAGDDIKLSSPISLTGGSSPTTTGTKGVGMRSRSDSAPMWDGATTLQGGLSANWTGRGRGNSFGQ